MQEPFISTLRYNLYLFSVVDECKRIQYNYINEEEHYFKGDNAVLSMIHHF